MTDETMSGGDRSPQLDLDAIEERLAVGIWPTLPDCDALVALVHRLQQENEELRGDVAFLGECQQGDTAALTRAYEEQRALRGRVEELTEALRALLDACDDPQVKVHDWDAAIANARLLARVDPEKETPLKKNEAPVKFVCAECGQAGVAEYHPYLYCELFKLGHADQEQYLAAYGFTRKTAR